MQPAHHAVHAKLTSGKYKLFCDSVRIVHAALLLKEEATVILDLRGMGWTSFDSYEVVEGRRRGC